MIIKIEDINEFGQGVGRINGKVVFVWGATIGDLVEVSIKKDKKRYYLGRVERLIEPSPDRSQPRCFHFSFCGGCQLQNLSYAAQLKYKQNLVQQSLSRIAGLKSVQINPIVPADQEYHYRNKAQVPFGWEERLRAGFYKIDSHEIVDLKECHIHPADFLKIILAVKDFVSANNLTVYNEAEHSGVFRYLIIRSSDYLKEILLAIVVNDDDLPEKDALLKKLADLNNSLDYKISTVILNINKDQTNRILGDYSRPLLGSGFITEKIGNYFFKVSLDTFLQVNRQQAEKAYALILARLPEKSKLIIDAYCGIGTITLNVAGKAEQIIGLEENPQSVKDAKRNAINNDIKNAVFIKGRAGDLPLADYGRPDVLIADPPRKGLEEKMLLAIKELRPKKILYMSCNPGTLARDIKLLLEDDLYQLKDVTPFDFFPQTVHVETVADLNLVID